MKTNFALRNTVCVALTLLLASAASFSHAAPAPPPSPILTNGAAGWDCLVNGQKGQQGILFITFTTNLDFYGNFTFTGIYFNTRVANPSSNGGRNSGGGGGRGGSEGATVPAMTNIYGAIPISGSWSWDVKKNVLGFFTELVEMGSEGTNATFITNQVSFTAKVTPNKKFTAVYSSSVGGNGVFQGLPMKGVTGLSGRWTATEKINNLSINEFFTMAPAPTFEGYTNIYDLFGSGPGYDLEGTCMVSSQKRIAFAGFKYLSLTNPPIQRATAGSLINSKTLLGGNTKGLIEPGTNVTYNAFWVSP